MSDYDDPATEEAWCDACRSRVVAYLRDERVDHGRVGECPAWHVAPYVSIWAVESEKGPGRVGWWVICGDLPTDYVSAAAIQHPRDAVLAFAARWREVARRMAAGESPGDVRIGRPEDRSSLAPLLETRASLLQEFADDVAIWEELDRERPPTGSLPRSGDDSR